MDKVRVSAAEAVADIEPPRDVRRVLSLEG
jgi:hypothetical protein